MVELRLVELRGLVDDEGSGPEVPPLEIGREDTVPTPAVEIPAVLTGTNVGNNTSDDIVIYGTTKQIPSRENLLEAYKFRIPVLHLCMLKKFSMFSVCLPQL